MTLGINSVTWYKNLEPVIKTWFNAETGMYPSRIGDFYNIMSSQRYEEIFQGVGAIGTDAWREYAKSGITPTVGANVGFEKTFRMQNFNVDLPIERTLIDDGMENTVMLNTQALAESAMQVREEDAASVFNNAFSTSYLGSDGYALCSDSHSTDNYLALTLTEANLETAKQAMYTFKNDRGSKLGSVPTLLLVPPALESTAKKLVLSQLQSGTANNDVNPHRELTYTTWHYLTDSNAWFLIDASRMKKMLMWINREILGIALDVGASRAEQAVYHARMRYAYGFIDWRWVIGCNPS